MNLKLEYWIGRWMKSHELNCELQKDRERLDWLAQHRCDIWALHVTGNWEVQSLDDDLCAEGTTLREAIDNAMKQKSQEETDRRFGQPHYGHGTEPSDE